VNISELREIHGHWTFSRQDGGLHVRECITLRIECGLHNIGLAGLYPMLSRPIAGGIARKEFVQCEMQNDVLTTL
jgi:hypothetical protein